MSDRLESFLDTAEDRYENLSVRSRVGMFIGGAVVTLGEAFLKTKGLEAEGTLAEIAGDVAVAASLIPGLLRSVGILEPRQSEEPPVQ